MTLRTAEAYAFVGPGRGAPMIASVLPSFSEVRSRPPGGILSFVDDFFVFVLGVGALFFV
jgi:hypothetical protein